MTQRRYHTPSELLTEVVGIDVVGAGGNGSALLDALASLEATLVALGHPGFDVRVFDPDTVDAANLGRQRFTSADLGRYKAHVLVHRLNMFYGVRWTSYACAYQVPKGLGRGRRTDMVISCVDSAAARVAIADEVSPYTLWLDLGNDAAHGQVVLGEGRWWGLSRRGQRSWRLPHVVDLFPELREAGEADEGPSCSVAAAVREQEWPVNRAAATHAATMLWQLFRHGGLDWHGVHFRLDPPSVTPIMVDPMAWQLYGYTCPSLSEDSHEAASDASPVAL